MIDNITSVALIGLALAMVISTVIEALAYARLRTNLRLAAEIIGDLALDFAERLDLPQVEAQSRRDRISRAANCLLKVTR